MLHVRVSLGERVAKGGRERERDGQRRAQVREQMDIERHRHNVRECEYTMAQIHTFTRMFLSALTLCSAADILIYHASATQESEWWWWWWTTSVVLLVLPLLQRFTGERE